MAAMYGEIEDTVLSSEMESGTVADQRPAGHAAPDDTLQKQLFSILAGQKQILIKVSDNGNNIDQNYKELKACIATEIKQVCLFLWNLHKLMNALRIS